MATIKDVARLAGVGLGTASRALSGKGSVAAATLDKVLKAAAELDFRPSHAARTLHSGNSQMIGVYIPSLNGTFHTPILQAIYSELRAEGLNMVVSFGVGDADSRQQAIEGVDFLLARGCDGLLLMSNALHDSDIVALGPDKSRLAVINHDYASIPGQCFPVDHVLGGRLAARNLLDLGHRRIAVIAGPVGVPDNVQRLAGFMSELDAAGIDTAQLWMTASDFTSAGGSEAARQLLDSDDDFTALFCANDEMAIGALSCFQQLGVEVPGQVSVLGYDDTNSIRFTVPRLSSVHIPWANLAENGLNYLLNGCYGLGRPVRRDFPLSVTLRASLSKAPGAARLRPAVP